MNKTTRLLVVDDDPNVVEIYTQMLRAEGFELRSSGSGRQGLEMAREQPPDLVLLDVGLPDLSGIEVCRRIKSDPSLSDTLVVLISGAATGSLDKVRGLEIGADDYLLKSAEWDEIRARIRTLLRLRDTAAALRDSEQHYRRLVEILPDAVTVVDLQGRLTAANSRALAMLAYDSQAELLEKTVFDLTPPEEHEHFRSDIVAGLQTGTILNRESTALRKNGERFPVELSAAVLKDSRERPFAIVSVFRDVTQRRRSEEMMRASVERFRQLAENIREVFWITDAEKQQMIYVSPGYETIWGRSCAELYTSPQDWISAVHPEDRERVQQAALTQQSRGDYDEVYRIVRPDGSIRWVQDRAFPIRDESGKVYRIVGIADDVTARRLAEQSLRESEARKGAIMQAALDGIITFDHTGRIIEVNFAAEKMFGYPASALLGCDLADTLIPTSLQAWFRLGLASLFAVDEGLVLGSRIEITALRAHRVEFPVEISVTRIELVGPPLFTAFLRDITGRRRTETKLATLVHALETTTEPVFTTDLKDRISFVNRAFQETYGYSEGEIMGRSPYPLLAPDAPPALAQEINAQTRSGGWRGEVLHQRRDGSKFPASLITSQIKDRTDRVIGYMYVAQDITERKRAEGQLRLLADAIRTTRDLIFITDPGNRFTFVNQAFREAYGYKEEEVLGKPLDLLWAAKSMQELRDEILLKTAEGGWRGETHHARKDGSEIPVSLTTSPIKGRDGTILHLVYAARDISDRKRALEELEESRRRQKSILDNIADPAWLKDSEGRFLAGNQSLARFFNRPLEAIIGRTVYDFLPKDEAAGLTHYHNEVIRTGHPALLEEQVTGPGGQARWFETLRSPISDHNGQLVGTVGIAREITERKRAETLLQLQCEFGIFLGATNDLKAALRRLVEIAMSLEGVDCGWVYWVEPRPGTLTLEAHEGLSPDFVKRVSHFAPDSPQARALKSAAAKGRTIDFWSGLGEELRRENLTAVDAIPIRQREEVVALLNLGSHSRLEIPLRSRLAIETTVAQVGGAIARIRTEQSLRASRQLLEKTVYSLHAAVFLVDGDTMVIRECNPAAERMFGRGANELPGLGIASLHTDQKAFENFQAHLLAAEQAEGIPGEFDFLMKRRDGAVFPTVQSLKPIREPSGRLASWVIVVHDVTERTLAEAELRQLPRRIIEAQEAERQRVAGELHDSVNQIIASVKMRIRNVGERLAQTEPAARETLFRCEKLLLEAIEENRRIARNLRPSDLDEFGLVAACRNFCKELRARAVLEVEHVISRRGRRLPPADELNLFRIMQEAVNNVEKHASASCVNIRLTFQKKSILLRIQDDGRGFDPWTSADSRRKRRGIGLTNMQQRAASLGATLSVQSAPKRGTIVTVVVPIKGAGREHSVAGGEIAGEPA